MIQEKISNKILTIGPDYRYPSGGIAKLLNTYSQFFNPFNFISYPVEWKGVCAT